MAAGQAADAFGAFLAFAPPAPTQGGPLAGLGFALKDMIEAAGRAATWGLAAPAGEPAVADAPLLAMLRAAGATLRGFTTMTPLAYEPSGGNPVQGRPRNPWSAAHICGGSSSGSAVAVAARLVDFAVGSDTGGSLRIPAQCCGVAAWKPTHGLLPLAGAMKLAPSLDTLGFLAADAQCLLRLAQALGVADHAPVARLLLAGDVAAGCDAQITAGLRQAASAGIAAGLDISDATLLPLIAACDAPVLAVMQAEAAQSHRDRIAAGGLDPVLASRLGKGLGIGAEDLAAALATLAALGGQEWPALLGTADAVLLPVMRIRTPETAVCEPGSPRFSARTLYELSGLTRWVNGLGLPAVALPVGRDRDGLPIAVQLVGRRGSDLALLATACRLQAALPALPLPPTANGTPA